MGDWTVEYSENEFSSRMSLLAESRRAAQILKSEGSARNQSLVSTVIEPFRARCRTPA